MTEKTLIKEKLLEWSELITKLSLKEIDLFEQKENYENMSEDIIEKTDFKEIYGKNNADIRKKHVKNELQKEYDEIKKLEFEIAHIKRQIEYTKQLIRSETVFLEIKQ